MNTKLYKGVWVREGFKVDKDMVKDCIDHYSHFDFDDESIVMDFGANIGGFAKMALEAGVKQYIAFEPDPDNYKVLKQNLIHDHTSIVALEAAASVSKEKTLTFYQNSSQNAPCSGTVSPVKPGIRKIRRTVENFNIDSMLEQYQPNCVKMDIEGAENKWLEKNQGKIPSHIEQFALELHTGAGFKAFEEIYSHNVFRDFRPVSVVPATGFTKPDSPRHIYPNMGIDVKSGTIFGIDIFLVRR